MEGLPLPIRFGEFESGETVSWGRLFPAGVRLSELLFTKLPRGNVLGVAGVESETMRPELPMESTSVEADVLPSEPRLNWPGELMAGGPGKDDGLAVGDSGLVDGMPRGDKVLFADPENASGLIWISAELEAVPVDSDSSDWLTGLLLDTNEAAPAGLGSGTAGNRLELPAG